MKVNQPVTGREIPIPEAAIIISKTDLKGIITYVNHEFVRISGFSEIESIGKNHNIIRHPDMPPAAFQDLWRTVQAGRPWTGIVKNRAKNGDHYWVKANVTPVIQQGRVLEYMSVRTQASLQEIHAAETLYLEINRKGSIKTGWAQQLFTRVANARLMTKFYLAMTVMFVSFICSGVFAWLPINQAQQQWTAYQASVAKRQSLISEIKSQFGYGGAIHNFKNYVLRSSSKYAERFQKNDQQLVKLLAEYAALEGLQDQERNALNDIGRVAANYRDMLKKIQPMVSGGANVRDIDKMVKVDDSPALAAFETLNEFMHRLTEKHTQHLGNTIEQGKMIALGMPPLGFLILFSLFYFVIKRGLLKPIRASINQFERIAEGHYFDDIELRRGDEIGDLFRGIKSMATKLGYDMNEARERADASQRIKTALDNVSSCVMMADNDRNIIYMNKMVAELFKNVETDIRKDIPAFDASQLLGSNIDSFHQHPQHQVHMLEKLETVHSSQLTIGGRTMRIVANPVFDDKGERLGTAMEWTDRTHEVAVEDELENIVASSLQGDLSCRVRLDGKQGFFKHLGKGINALIEQMNAVFEDVAKALARISEGNLGERINRNYAGAFGLVEDNLNNTMDKLRTTIAELRSSMDVVRTASDEISSGNTNLSARTEQQASSLQETASSMEELTSTVRNNADNAQQANQLSLNARNTAETGTEVLHRAIEAMNQINESSARIAEIIGVIDEIAFQTNLLALNASVEAARAGEQGRGFAVVATEVRNLAGRSATAAKEIKELIQDSLAKVENGSGLVNQSGKSLEEILGEIRKVGDIISEIAAASREQSAGIDQVNQAVTSMDEMTQQNAALAEQTSAAASSMADKAVQMERMMAFFDTEEKAMVKEEEDQSNLDFFSARSAHLSWKHRLRKFLDGEIEMRMEDAVSHTECKLGKWLYGHALEAYQDLPEMTEMEQTHKHMHDIIKQLVEMNNSGRHDEAERHFAKIGPMSDNVVHALRTVEDKIE